MEELLCYVHCTGLPSISYPREGQVIPAGDSPCVVTGEPEPLLQVLRGIDDHSAFTCIASSVHVNAPHMAVRPSVFVSYRGKLLCVSKMEVCKLCVFFVVEEPEVISNPPMPESRFVRLCMLSQTTIVLSLIIFICTLDVNHLHYFMGSAVSTFHGTFLLILLQTLVILKRKHQLCLLK